MIDNYRIPDRRRVYKIAWGVLLLSFAAFQIVHGAENTSASEHAMLKRATDAFMMGVSKGQFNESLSALIESLWYKRADNDTFIVFKSEYEGQQPKLEQTVGKRTGDYEFLGSRRLGQSFLRLIYMEKHVVGIQPWAFGFYKAGQEWRLVSLEYGGPAAQNLEFLVITESVK